MKKILAVMLAAALVLLAGCGASPTPASQPAPAAPAEPAQSEPAAQSQPQEEPAAASAQSDVTLKYWAAPLSKPEIVSATWDRVIADFRAETGINVEYEVIPWTDTVKKLTTAITSGEGPDIAGTGNNMSIQLSPTGALLPLTPDRFAKIGGRDKFIETVATVTGEEGKDPVTIPLNGGSGLVVFDREAYASVGMTSMPEKWEDFIAYAQQLSSGNTYGYGVYGKPTQSWKLYNNIFHQVRMGKALDDAGRPAFDSPEGIKAFMFLADLVGKYKIVPPVCAEWAGDELIAAFVNGDVKAMYIDAENLSILDDSKMAGKYEIDVMPYILPGETQGVPCVSHAGGTNVGIFAQTKYEEESLKFLEFISRKDVNVSICADFGVLSSVKGAYEGSSDQRTVRMVEILETYTIPMPLRTYYLPSLNAASTAVQSVLFQASTDAGVSEDFIRQQLQGVMAEAEQAMAAAQ